MQFAGKLETLNNYDRAFIKEWVERFLEKNERFVKSGVLKLRLEQRREKFREVPLFSCRANFYTDGDRFIASGEEYGIKQCVGIALSKVRRQLIRKKERV